MNNAYEWVENQTGQKVSELGRKVCFVLSMMGHGGIYNRPISWDRVDWSNNQCVEVNWGGGEIANWDFCDLTALWGHSGEIMLRVAIAPSSPRHIKLRFWQRKTREGGMAERLPTLVDQLKFAGIDLQPSVSGES